MGNIYKNSSRCCLFILCFCLSTATYAGVFDGIKEKYSDIKTVVKQKITPKKIETVAVLSDEDVKELQQRQNEAQKKLEELPKGWVTNKVKEPVFGSDLFFIETGKQNSNTLVFVHGLGSAGLRDWMGIIPKLEKNFHIIAMDLPGFGSSGRPKGRYSPTNYAKVVNWVVEKYAHDNVFVAGHSMGGAVALRYASMYPDALQKLILVDAAGILERTSFIKHMSSIPVDLTRVPDRFKKMVAYAVDFSQSFVEMTALNHDISCVVQKDEEAWNNAFAGSANANAGLALVIENFSGAAKDLKVPLHMIWGERDRVAPLRTGVMLEKIVKGSVLTPINGAGHVPMKSHTDQFMQHFKYALLHKPKAKKQLNNVESDLDLSCDGEVAKRYSGSYRNVVIKNCTAITLENLSAKSIVVNNSTVEMTNVRVKSNETALYAEESVIMMTAVDISGKTPIYSTGSRLDIAGASLSGDESIIDVGTSSRIILSISEYETELSDGNLHGFYDFADDKLLNRIDENRSFCK